MNKLNITTNKQLEYRIYLCKIHIYKNGIYIKIILNIFTVLSFKEYIACCMMLRFFVFYFFDFNFITVQLIRIGNYSCVLNIHHDKRRYY